LFINLPGFLKDGDKMKKEVRLIKVMDNPTTDVPGHTVCTAKEIAGPLIGIDSYSMKLGFFGKGGIAEEHMHTVAEHVFYVLTGALCVTAEGKDNIAQVGEALHIPAGIPHSAKNAFDGETRYVALTLPPT
jgi:quercetin dioxygenase-like cupin family protein